MPLAVNPISASVAFLKAVGDEIGEERAGGDVGERVGDIPRRHRQWLIDAVTARREYNLGDILFELVDLVGNGPVAGYGVVDRVEPVGLDRQLVAVHRDHQFAEVLSVLSGLDHGRASVDDDRLVQLGVAVAADDNVDARHGLGQAHVLAVGVASVFSFLMPPWLSAMTTSAFSVSRRTFTISFAVSMGSENLTARRLGVELRLFAEQPEDAEADAAALDHSSGGSRHPWPIAGDRPTSRLPPSKLVFEATTAGTWPALTATAIDSANAIGPEVEIMVAKGSGLVTHQGHELQFAACFAGGRGERGPHAVVARVKDQNRVLMLARVFPLSRSSWLDARSHLGSCRC